MQIPFNGTNFINAWLMRRIFSVWPVAQPKVGEMEMHSDANQPHEVLISQHAHTSLSLSLCLLSFYSARTPVVVSNEVKLLRYCT